MSELLLTLEPLGLESNDFIEKRPTWCQNREQEGTTCRPQPAFSMAAARRHSLESLDLQRIGLAQVRILEISIDFNRFHLISALECPESGAGSQRALEKGLQPPLLRAGDRRRSAGGRERGEGAFGGAAQRLAGPEGGAAAAAGAAVDVHRPTATALCAHGERPDGHAGRPAGGLLAWRDEGLWVGGTPMTPKPSNGPYKWAFPSWAEALYRALGLDLSPFLLATLDVRCP